MINSLLVALAVGENATKAMHTMRSQAVSVTLREKKWGAKIKRFLTYWSGAIKWVDFSLMFP